MIRNFLIKLVLFNNLMVWMLYAMLVDLLPEAFPNMTKYERINIDGQVQGAWMLINGGMKIPVEMENHLVTVAITGIGLIVGGIWLGTL